MDDRQTILNRIYKTCFRYAYIREAFEQQWKYVYDSLVEGGEDEFSTEVLDEIDVWMDVM